MSNREKNVVIIILVVFVAGLIFLSQTTSTSNTMIRMPKFPVQKEANKESHQAIIEGTLRLNDDCLTIKENTIIWPADTYIIKDSTIRIFNAKGKQIARLGDSLLISGGQIDDKGQYDIGNCNNKLWLASRIEILH